MILTICFMVTSLLVSDVIPNDYLSEDVTIETPLELSTMSEEYLLFISTTKNLSFILQINYAFGVYLMLVLPLSISKFNNNMPYVSYSDLQSLYDTNDIFDDDLSFVPIEYLDMVETQ